MTHIDTKIQHYIAPGRRVHLAGIGGVSMSPLAEVLHGMGLTVQGSDQTGNAVVDHLRSLGISIHVGHTASDIEGAEFVIRTAAIHDDNPEIAAAHRKGIPVFERAEAWGAIMQQYENAVCIAGTHGKTTTTSMTTHIFMAAQADPTVMIGGTLPMLHSGYRVGRGDTIILESCEYCNSFLHFFPTVAVVLNVEADHLDFFKDLDDIKQSFRRFAQLTSMIALYFDETMASGFAAQNQILQSLSSMLLMTGKEQPDIRKATQQAAQAVSLNKIPVFQADLTNIQNQFMAVLREIKKEMTSGEGISQNMTKELTEQMFSELTKGQDLHHPSVSPEQLAAMVVQPISQMGLAEDELLAELKQALLHMMERMQPTQSDENDDQ